MPLAGASGSSPCRFTTIASSGQPAPRAFGEAIAARRVVGARHRDAHAAAVERVGDARVVRRDDDVGRAGRERAARDVHDHRLAGDRRERLARQAGRGDAGGNRDDEPAGGHERGSVADGSPRGQLGAAPKAPSSACRHLLPQAGEGIQRSAMCEQLA